jgi:hypothetical protein
VRGETVFVCLRLFLVLVDNRLYVCGWEHTLFTHFEPPCEMILLYLSVYIYIGVIVRNSCTWP